MAKIKVALIGYGHLGRWHAQKVVASPRAELVAVVEKAPANRAAAEKEGLPVASDLQEVLDKIDAAVIATPASTHFALASALVAAQKHVFCEKPVTFTLAEAQTLQNAASKVPGLIFQVGHSERCHEVWEWFKPGGGPANWPCANILPVPGTWYLKRLAPFNGRATDVDVIADLMIHDIDLMLWHLQAMPLEVTAYGHQIRTGKWDHVTAHFKFASGHQVFILAGRNWGVRECGLAAINELGVLQIDLLNQKVLWASKDSSAAQGPTSFTYQKRDHLQLEQDKFYQAIQEQQRPWVSLAEGKNAVAVAEMVLHAFGQSA